MSNANQQIEIYQSDDGQLELKVALDDETLWLTQAQLAELFQVKPQNITMHLKNIFADGELQEEATCKDFLQVQNEGGREVKRKRKFYNLDAIISVGYRVNSSRATQFRIWATRTLKQHLVEGYTLNQRRLQERGIEFEQAISLLSRTLENQQLVSPDGEAVLPSFPRSRVGMHTGLSKPLREMAGQGSHAGAWEPAVIYAFPSFPRSRVGMHNAYGA